MPARKAKSRRSGGARGGRTPAKGRGGGKTPRSAPSSSRKSASRRKGRPPKDGNSERNSTAPRRKSRNPWEESGSEDETAHRLDFDSDSSFEDEEEDREGMDSEGMVPSDDEDEGMGDLDVVPSKRAKVGVETRKKKPPKPIISGLEEEAESGSEDEVKEEERESSFEDRFRVPSPVWNLKQCPWVEAPDLPKLNLPPSSEDLLVPRHLVFDSLEVYDICRRFSQTIKLSPFLFEDFCAALMSKEQSRLLAEIHISLLKLLMKEDDDEKQIVFGPWDMRDSQNIASYLIDGMTYAEVLRQYLDSDRKRFPRNVLNAVTNGNYPFVSPAQRLTVLKWLCARFLQSNAFRKEVKCEGVLTHDEHCRDCGKAGELICCDSCSAAYHLRCVDPPLEQCPAESELWYCSICHQHQVKGVFDCMSPIESKGLLIRQESLGFDRHGRRYWFLVRRIFVQDESTGEVWYYSTLPQLRGLFEKLDDYEWETSLCEALTDLLTEIGRQMTITAELTESNKSTNKSYFQSANEEIMKQIQLSDKEDQPPRLQPMNALEEAFKSRDKDSEPARLEDVSKPDFCNGDWGKGEDGDDGEEPEKNLFESMKEFERKSSERSDAFKRNSMTQLVDRVIEKEGWSDKDVQRKIGVKNEPGSKSELAENRAPSLNKNARFSVSATRNQLANRRESMLKKETVVASPEPTKPSIIDPNTLFKLGMDPNKGYRRYMNQYSVNDYAKTPYARAQERTRGNYMEKKFSLSDEGYFEWPQISDSGTGKKGDQYPDIFMDQKEVNEVIYHSLNKFLQRIPVPFWHRAWDSSQRVKFRRASTTAHGPKQLKHQLAVMESCLKRCVFQKSWQENLGHTRLVRQTPVDREDRQKAEKKKRMTQKALLAADPSEETENIVWVKYTRTGGPPGHQVWKQKDEGYRVNSEGNFGGWMWVSSLRRPHYENPQLTVPSDALPADSPARKKRARLETLVKGFAEKREEQWRVKQPARSRTEIRSRQKEIQTSVCFSPSCRKGLHFAPVAGPNSITQSCYNPICRRRYKEATEQLPKDSQSPVKVVPKSKFHVSPGGKIERQQSYGRDKPFPMAPVQKFRPPNTEKGSILALSRPDLSSLARKGGLRLTQISGFRWDSKSSPVLWPYPCARPTFELCWRYMTQTARNHHGVALQLRILWANIRWEELEKNHPLDAKLTMHYDEHSETREVVDHKEFPPHGIFAKYQLRITMTPNENVQQTKADEEDEDWTPTPRRSAGNKNLRERPRKVGARPEPKKTTGLRAVVKKDAWIEEGALKLWEIKNYWTKYEMKRREPPPPPKPPERPPPEKVILQRGGAHLAALQRVKQPPGIPAPISQAAKLAPAQRSLQNANWRAKDLANIQQQQQPPQQKSMRMASPYVLAPGNRLAGSSGPGILASSRRVSAVAPPRNTSQIQRPPTVVMKEESQYDSGQDQRSPVRRMVFRQGAGGHAGAPPKVVTPGVTPRPPPTATPIRIIKSGEDIRSVNQNVLNPARPIVVRPGVVSAPGTKIILIQQRNVDGKTFITKAQPTALAQPFGANRPSTVTGRVHPNQTPLRGVPGIAGRKSDQPADPDHPLVGTSGEGLAASPNKERPLAPKRDMIYYKEQDGTLRMVRNIGGRPRGPAPEKVSALPEGRTMDTTRIPGYFATRPAPSSIRRVRQPLKDEFELTADSLTEAVHRRIPYIADDSESREKVLQFQKRASRFGDTEGYGMKEEEDEDELIDVETAEPTSFSSASSSQRLYSAGGNNSIRSPYWRTRAAGNYRIGKPNSEHTFASRYGDSKTRPPGLSRSYQASRPPPGRNTTFDLEEERRRVPGVHTKQMELVELRRERKLQQDREKVCKKVLDGLIDQILKEERDEMRIRDKETARARRREYDRIYRAKKKYEKEVDIMVQERMQNIRREVHKRRGRLEQQAEIQVGIGLWNLKGKPPPGYPHAVTGSKRKLSERLFTPFGAGALTAPPTMTPRVPEPSSILGQPPSQKKVKREEDFGSPSNKKKPSDKDKEKPEFTACCRTPYDPTRFYVKCDLCPDWFHGSCVGVNAKKARKMDSFTCERCEFEKKKTEEELYCLCRTPYDVSQFYVGCDGCEGWFHPRCVGISQSEAEQMPTYFCPTCALNGGNASATAQQPLRRQDYTKLFEILDTLKENRNSWPFRTPVDPVRFPNYYVMIRSPMDLQTVEEKLNRFDYLKLGDFVADISKIFDNARLFNLKDSAIHQCAVILEKRFDESLANLKEQLAAEQAKQEAELAAQQRRMEEELEEEEEEVEVDGEAEVEVDVEELVEEEIIMNPDGDLFLGDENIVVVDGDDSIESEDGQLYNDLLEFSDDVITE